MKILIATSEIADVAPVGGIAEYVFGLATSLLKRGHEVRVAIPFYAYLRDRQARPVAPRLVVPLGVGASEVTAVAEFSLPPSRDGLVLPVTLLGEHRHFATVQAHGQIYQWPNHEPWVAFARAIVEFLGSSAWRPDVIHCQDAHTALVPVYLRHLRNDNRYSSASSANTVLTIHNLLNQGLGPPQILAYAGLPDALFNVAAFEFYGAASCLKAGLLSADRVNTVSHTYAREICEGPDFGFGLEGVLRTLRDDGRLSGIVNGIDEDRWRLDGLHYDGTDRLESIAAAKRSCRQQFYPRWGWDDTKEPVISFRGRWDHQKGVELIGERLERLLDHAKVVVGTWAEPGSTPELRRCWETLKTVEARRPGRLLVNPEGVTRVDETATHYVISDFLLMPSRYEPCGLTHMECQRYGTIPIVRHTGGLADTVSERVTPRLSSPNGFVFDEYDPDAMIAAVDRAVSAFRDADSMRVLTGNALRQRNGWDTRVTEYEALYGA